MFDLDFGPDGYLYVTLGDGGEDGEESQDVTNIFGNVIRINPMDPNGTAPVGEKISGNGKYSIPLDNPLVGQGGGVIEEAWAYGLRSPFTLNFSNNGELYEGDVGAGQREEVNRITQGSNQGWSRFEGTRNFEPSVSLVPGTVHNPPIFEYVHPDIGDGGRVVVAGFVYDGDFLPDIQGKFIFADFQGNTEEGETPVGRLFYGDLSNGDIFEFNYDGMDLNGLSILNIGQDSNGEIFIATSVASVAENAPADPDGGAIFRIMSTIIPGDFDENGTVNDADLAQWEGDFGVNGDSDADGDGDSDGSDLLIWQRNVGLSNVNLSSAIGVPEPSMPALLVAAMLHCSVFVRNRRRQKRCQEGSVENFQFAS